MKKNNNKIKKKNIIFFYFGDFLKLLLTLFPRFLFFPSEILKIRLQLPLVKS